MLGARHATRQPPGLNRMAIPDSPASMPPFMAATNTLREGLPREIQDTLAKHETNGTTDNKEYEDAIQVFYARHLCRVQPMPEFASATFEWIAKDPTVYHTMNGPSDFFVNGTIKDWTIIPDIPKIKVSTLLLNGRYDEVQDSAVQSFWDLIPKVKWFQFSEGSHSLHIEETDLYLRVAGNFLTA